MNNDVTRPLFLLREYNKPVPFRILRLDYERPYERAWHWQGERQHACTAVLDGFSGRCIYCYASRQPGSTVKAAQFGRMASVFDCRVLHVKTQQDWTFCPHAAHTAPEDRLSCPSCLAGVERFISGRRLWEVSHVVHDRLVGFQQEIERTCARQHGGCGNQLQLCGFTCSSCGMELHLQYNAHLEPARISSEMSRQHVYCKRCRRDTQPAPIWRGPESCANRLCHNGNTPSAGQVHQCVLQVELGRVVLPGGKIVRNVEIRYDRVPGYDGHFIGLNTWMRDLPCVNPGIEPYTPQEILHWYRPEWITLPSSPTDLAPWVARVFQSQAKRLGIENPYKNVTEST